MQAMDLLEKTANGKFPYAFVSDSAAARLVMVLDSSLGPEACGQAKSRYQDNVVISGQVVIRDLECATAANLAHEVTHLLGLGGHMEAKQDILSSPALWAMSTRLAGLINWLLEVPVGTIPVDG